MKRIYEWHDIREINLNRNLTINVDDTFISPNELAEYLNVPQETVQDHVKSPDFPQIMVLQIAVYFDYELEEYKRKLNN